MRVMSDGIGHWCRLCPLPRSAGVLGRARRGDAVDADDNGGGAPLVCNRPTCTHTAEGRSGAKQAQKKTRRQRRRKLAVLTAALHPTGLWGGREAEEGCTGRWKRQEIGGGAGLMVQPTVLLKDSQRSSTSSRRAQSSLPQCRMSNVESLTWLQEEAPVAAATQLHA